MGGPGDRGRRRRLQRHDFAGGWNDGSRLATVESLVDHQTWAIDDSVFVRPSAVAPGAPAPYPPSDYNLMHGGTLDKLRINGHYYSDKSPTPSLWLAAVYAVFRFVTGWTAATHADAFCYVLTLASSGLAYVVAVWSVWRLGRPLGLSQRLRLLLTAAFALATVALPYARHVNNHILLLGVLAALDDGNGAAAHGAPPTLPSPSEGEGRVGGTWGRMLRLGVLAGLSYGIDVGTGPLLVGGAAVWVLYRCRRLAPLTLFAAGGGAVGGAAPRPELHDRRHIRAGQRQPCLLRLARQSVERADDDRRLGPCGRAVLHPVRAGPVGRQAGLSRPQSDAGRGRRGLLAAAAVPAAVGGSAGSDPGGRLVRRYVAAVFDQLDEPFRRLLFGAVVRAPFGAGLLHFGDLAARLPAGPAARLRHPVRLGRGAGALMWWAGPWTPHRIPGYWAIQVASLTSLLASIYLRWRDQPVEAKPAAPEAQRRAA